MTTIAKRAVWVVKAEESCDSSGGVVTLLIVTADGASVPDVHAAYARQRKRDCSLYVISSMERLGEFEEEGFLLMDDLG